MSKKPPNFRHSMRCFSCKYLKYDPDADPTQSRVCSKYDDTILSNYMAEFYVCDSFKDVDDE